MDAERDDEVEVHFAITSIKRNGVAIKGTDNLNPLTPMINFCI